MNEEAIRKKSAGNKLKEFEEFMSSYGHGWALVNKTDKLVSYQQVLPAENGSCLVAFILFWFFIIPAILYMVYGRKPARTHQLTVTLNDSGQLLASGDGEGLWIYKKFTKSLEPSSIKANNYLDKKKIIGGIVLMVIGLVIALTSAKFPAGVAIGTIVCISGLGITVIEMFGQIWKR